MRASSLVILVLWTGCGNVKDAPDAPPGTADGPPIDADPSRPDGMADAGTCEVACQAPDLMSGPALGTAPCASASTSCVPSHAWLETIDVCGCTAGSPSLYLFPVGAAFSVALVVSSAVDPSASWSILVGGNCYGGAPACPTMMPCAAGEVWGWSGIQIPAAGGRLTVHLDSGVGCTASNQRYEFTLTP